MKKILIFSFILWFCIINFFSFQDFYWNALGNHFFSYWNFSKATSYYLKSNSKESIFNKANTLYKEKKYLESNEKYLSIFTPEKNEFYFKLNHNIGNNYYKLSLDNKQKEKEYLEQSVTYYTNALDIRYDEETKKNLEFVMNKLKEIKEKEQKKKQEEQKKEQNSDQSGTGTQSNQNTGSWTNSENSQNWSGTTNENTNQNTGSGNTQTQRGSVSKEENKTGSGSEKSQSGSTASSSNKPEEKWNSPEIEKQLKAYEEQLKEEQKQNQSEVWKVYQPQNSQDPFSQFDNFFNTPSFDNSLLNDADNKKDW